MWALEQRSRCGRCGTWPWEWDENPNAWVADHEDCQGCRRLDLESDAIRKSPGLHAGTRTILVRGSMNGRP